MWCANFSAYIDSGMIAILNAFTLHKFKTEPLDLFEQFVIGAVYLDHTDILFAVLHVQCPKGGQLAFLSRKGGGRLHVLKKV